MWWSCRVVSILLILSLTSHSHRGHDDFFFSKPSEKILDMLAFRNQQPLALPSVLVVIYEREDVYLITFPSAGTDERSQRR